MFSNQLVNIPEDFLCPITQEMMENPVMAADGHTYEKAAIVRWLETGHRTSPLTGERLKHDTLTDNFALKKTINTFKEKLPQIQRERQIKIDLDEAVKLREEMVAHYLEKKEQENLGFINELANEKSKNQRLERELAEMKKMMGKFGQLEEEKQKNNYLEKQVVSMSNEMSEMRKMMEQMQRMMLGQSPNKQNEKELLIEKNPSSNFMPQYQAFNESPIIKKSPKQIKIESPKVNPKDVQTFLDLVAAGQQPKAEAMLKKNPDLALAYGTITDPAKRTFKDITGFQYAVWALDWHMWQMIRKYMPKEAAQEQAKGFGTGAWVKDHGEHAGWAIKKVTDAQQMLNDNWDSWDCDNPGQQWLLQVGGAQLILPIHVLQEYSQPNRPFDPCPKFNDIYDLERSLPDWLQKGHQDHSLSGMWAIMRGVVWSVGMSTNVRRFGLSAVAADISALVELSNTRTQQRGELVVELVSDKKPSPFKK